MKTDDDKARREYVAHALDGLTVFAVIFAGVSAAISVGIYYALRWVCRPLYAAVFTVGLVMLATLAVMLPFGQAMINDEKFDPRDPRHR